MLNLLILVASFSILAVASPSAYTGEEAIEPNDVHIRLNDHDVVYPVRPGDHWFTFQPSRYSNTINGLIDVREAVMLKQHDDAVELRCFLRSHRRDTFMSDGFWLDTPLSASRRMATATSTRSRPRSFPDVDLITCVDVLNARMTAVVLEARDSEINVVTTVTARTLTEIGPTLSLRRDGEVFETRRAKILVAPSLQTTSFLLSARGDMSRNLRVGQVVELLGDTFPVEAVAALET